MTIDQLSKIDDQYLTWAFNTDNSKVLEVQIESIALQIIFVRGKNIYTIKNSPTPFVTNNMINVSSDDPKISKLFKEYFPLSKPPLASGLYVSKQNEVRAFELRFFPTRESLAKKLAEEHAEYIQYSEPKFTGISTCCVLV